MTTVDEPDQLWHVLRSKDSLQRLDSSLDGLQGQEARHRLEVFGYNELKETRAVSWIKILLNQFRSFLVGLLLVSIVLSALFGEIKDALAISAIVVLNVILGFIQERRAEKALEALRKLITLKATVRRDGKRTLVPAREVVPGDIVILEPGDRVPADSRLLTTIDLMVDESVLTGESVPVAKDAEVILEEEMSVSDRRNMAFMSTMVARGVAEAVVTSTGMETEMGKVAEMVQTIEEKKTPLARKLDQFGKQLTVVIILLIVVGFLLGAYREKEPFEMFELAVSLAVSAVPEGLPAVVTITLALGVRQMAKRNSIVRKLSAVETLGRTTVICADKTGTMTENEMTVRQIYVNRQTIDVTGAGYEPKGDFLREGVSFDPIGDEHSTLLLRALALCNHARLEEAEGNWRIVGDPTEGALVTLAAKAGIQKEDEEKKYPLLFEIPFDSARKRMTTVHETPARDRVAYLKGAPEVLLGLSTHIYEGGKTREIEEEDYLRILEMVQDMAKQALRVIAAAYKVGPLDAGDQSPEELESDLVFVGLAAMIDPPRKEVKGAVELCKKAGVNVIMITGDHKLTALAIAEETGIIEDDRKMALTGDELVKMSDEELEGTVESIAVFARVSPEHKMRIVSALKQRGHVVAMTGDGVNDAPSLKMADIGVAMGIKGTDVAREASSMVLSDDNFATIVSAVESGRGIYDNIRKFIRFLLACNFDEIAVITTCILADLPLALLPIQILWLNLVTDGAPATALSVDPQDADIMERAPRSPKEGILSGMSFFIFSSALFQYVGTMTAFLIGLFVFKESVAEARTLAFTQAVLFELFVVFNCRSERHSIYKVGFFTNKPLLVAVLGSLLLQVALVYVPFLQLVFETVPLTLQDWGLCALLAGGGWLMLPEIFMRNKSAQSVRVSSSATSYRVS